MNENPLLCANGCTDKGTETPRLAKYGNFCAREYRAAVAALNLAPELVEHMVSLKPHPAAATERVDTSREAPAPGNEQAMNDSHETYRRLVYWSALWAKRMGVQAPAPAVGAWRDGKGVIVGFPENVSPKGASFVTRILTDWLDKNLEAIFYLTVDDVNFFITDLRDVFRLDARWPRNAKPYFSKLPCPDDKGRIAVYPPRWAGDDVIYKCEMCGRLFTEDQHEFYARLFAQVSAEPNAVKRHLMRKYGA